MTPILTASTTTRLKSAKTSKQKHEDSRQGSFELKLLFPLKKTLISGMLSVMKGETFTLYTINKKLFLLNNI